MRLKSFQIINYKSFKDIGEHRLAPRMNVIVGQNNSGKTALLQAIGLRLQPRPHRDSEMRPEQADDPSSRVRLNFIASGQELSDWILKSGQSLEIPVPMSWGSEAKSLVNKFFGLPEITFSVGYRASQGQGTELELTKFPSNNLFIDNPNEVHTLRCQPNAERNGFVNANIRGDKRDNIGLVAGGLLQSKIYLFDSQRTPRSTCQVGTNVQLASNAENLAEVLSILQSSPTEYREFMDQVRRVIPLVKWVSTVPDSANSVGIRIWNVEEHTKRTDLAVPLVEAGTGIGQVLAILYVVMRSRGNIIMIDEPNSFLHPGAAKILMNILWDYPQHQFVISTHSPEIIVAAQPERLFMLKLDSERTTIQELDREDVDSARQVLTEIGSRFSDVFGTDSVIWVEGPTEVECFPLLLKADGKALPAGVSIARLANTDDLQGRHAEIIAGIYRNLTAAGSILPKIIAVSLDGDKAQSKGLPALRRACGDTLRFLPRRTYENYLLHLRAITALLNALPTFVASPIAADIIARWFADYGKAQTYHATEFEPLSQDWLRAVDGSRLLEHLFEEISETKETFRKPLHSVWLTQWLLEHEPTALQELIDYVVSVAAREA